MAQTIKRHWNKFTQNKKGEVVLWQFPNLPIIGWAICRLLSDFLGPEYLKTGFSSLANASLFVWAYLEITKGDSYFRKSLGTFVMIFLVYGFFKK